MRDKIVKKLFLFEMIETLTFTENVYFSFGVNTLRNRLKMSDSTITDIF